MSYTSWLTLRKIILTYSLDLTMGTKNHEWIRHSVTQSKKEKQNKRLKRQENLPNGIWGKWEHVITGEVCGCQPESAAQWWADDIVQLSKLPWNGLAKLKDIECMSYV